MNKDLPPYSWPRVFESVLVWCGRIIYGLLAMFLLVLVLGTGGKPSAALKLIPAAIIVMPILLSFKLPRTSALIMAAYGLFLLVVSARGAYWGDDTYGVSRFAMCFIAPIPLIAAAFLFAGASGPARRRKRLNRTSA